MALSKEAPLFVDLRIFPERPETINTPEPERISAVSVVTVDPELLAESSLPPQEIMAEAKPAIKKVYKIFFIQFQNWDMNSVKAKLNILILGLTSVGMFFLLMLPASLSANHFR